MHVVEDPTARSFDTRFGHAEVLGIGSAIPASISVAQGGGLEARSSNVLSCFAVGRPAVTTEEGRDEDVPNARFDRARHAAGSAGHRSATEHGHPGGVAMTERYVLGFQEIDQTQVAVVGGKGANLGELSRIEGIRVPPGNLTPTTCRQPGLRPMTSST